MKTSKSKGLLIYIICILLAAVIALGCLITYDSMSSEMVSIPIAWVIIPLAMFIIVTLFALGMNAVSHMHVDDKTSPADTEPAASVTSTSIDTTPNNKYYYYTGPKNTFRDQSWNDQEAYELGLYETPTGSIHIKHPDLEMLCRVTDSENMPGFLINCKDGAGKRREFQVYYNERTKDLVVCTSNETDKSLTMKEQIHGHRYAVPFVDHTYPK